MNRATRAACLRGAATAFIFEGVQAAQNLARAPAENTLLPLWWRQKLEESLVGEHDLPELVERQQKTRHRIGQNAQQFPAGKETCLPRNLRGRGPLRRSELGRGLLDLRSPCLSQNDLHRYKNRPFQPS